MKKAYYLFNPGRMSRRDNTLKFTPAEAKDTPAGKPRYLPVEGVSALYVFGSLDTNSALYNFLGRHHIPVHFFDYYQHYTGSFNPKEYLLAGQLLIAQANAYDKKKKRLSIATALVDTAIANMIRNLRYYQNRGKEVNHLSAQLALLQEGLTSARSVGELMGFEGNARQIYYASFGAIVDTFSWSGRKKATG
jgi:CRISPR-associated protein Cas1